MARIYLDSMAYERLLDRLARIEDLSKTLVDPERKTMALRVVDDYNRIFDMIESYQKRLLEVQLDVMNAILEVSKQGGDEDLNQVLYKVKGEIDEMHIEFRRFKTLFKDKITDINKLEIKTQRAQNLFLQFYKLKTELEEDLALQQDIDFKTKD